jgi:periplasmic copper chaperone A
MVCAVSPATSAALRSRWALLAALAVLVFVAGCAAGQRAPSSSEISTIDGVNANIGSMQVRNLGLAAPPTTSGYAVGDSAQLVFAMVNTGARDDQLTSVTSPVASSATSTSVSPVASPTTSAARAQPRAFVPISVQPGELVPVGYGSPAATVTLVGLTKPLISGQTLVVTLGFRNAGTRTIRITVRLGEGAISTPTVNVAPPEQ